MLRKLGGAFALPAACAVLILAVFGAGLADAHRGKAVALQESAALKITKNEGNLHEADGRTSGTVKGQVHVVLTVEDASHITGRYSIKGPGGGLTGTVAAGYTVSGSVLRFTGTSRVIGGSGPYSGASGRGVRIEGEMNRLKGTMTVTLTGNITV